MQILSPLPYTLNIKGRLFSLDKPQVMGIVNVTPDSFYSGSRTQDDEAIAARCRTIRDEGATIIDIGAYSSRSGADDVPAEEEMARLRRGLTVVRRECPDMVVSVDTFRADVARMCVEEYGADIINDISGGTMDHQMFRTVARLGVPYILMHMQGTPQTMQDNPQYADLMRDVFVYFAERINRLHDMGVADIILDPGFGFGKTLADNYTLLAHLSEFHDFGLPLLVGVSRKSMIYKLVGGTPAEALNGTTAIHTASLLQGAAILRVHDVKPAVEAVQIVEAMRTNA